MRFHEVEPREARACPSERGARRFTPLRDLSKSVAIPRTTSNICLEKFGVYKPPKTLLAFLEIPPLGFVTSVGMTHNVGATSGRPAIRDF